MFVVALGSVYSSFSSTPGRSYCTTREDDQYGSGFANLSNLPIRITLQPEGFGNGNLEIEDAENALKHFENQVGRYEEDRPTT
jgi:hypothetical protein